MYFPLYIINSNTCNKPTTKNKAKNKLRYKDNGNHNMTRYANKKKYF